jgi:type IV secretory pathway VirB2 component (pilin)
MTAISAVALMAAPTMAAAQPAQAPVREVAPSAEEVEGEQIRGGFLLPLAVIVAIIIGIILLTGDDEPESP